MKPEITGWLRKLASQPSRKMPMTSSSRPESPASSRATPRYSGLPGTATSLAAAKVISETTATGPTASTRLEPNSA